MDGLMGAGKSRPSVTRLVHGHATGSCRMLWLSGGQHGAERLPLVLRIELQQQQLPIESFLLTRMSDRHVEKPADFDGKEANVKPKATPANSTNPWGGVKLRSQGRPADYDGSAANVSPKKPAESKVPEVRLKKTGAQ